MGRIFILCPQFWLNAFLVFRVRPVQRVDLHSLDVLVSGRMREAMDAVQRPATFTAAAMDGAVGPVFDGHDATPMAPACSAL